MLADFDRTITRLRGCADRLTVARVAQSSQQ